MIRLYRAMVEQLLMAVMYLQDRGVKADDATAVILKHFKTRGDMNVVRTTYNNGVSFHDWTAIIEQLRDVLGGPSDQHTDDSRLVDTIVRILQLPHARNILSGKTYNALKKALLMPDELGKLLDAKRLEAGCVECGHTFEEGEVATVHFDGDYVFKCVLCYIPTLTRCSVCGEGNAPLSDKVRQLLGRTNCGCNKKKGIEATEVPQPEPQAYQAVIARQAAAVEAVQVAHYTEIPDILRGLRDGPAPTTPPRWGNELDDREYMQRIGMRRRPGGR